MRRLWLATVALIGLSGGWAFGDYAATQGSGTTFGSVVVGGVHYVQHFICDLTVPARCATVSAAGAVKVDGSAVTQPVSAAALPLPTGAATEATLATMSANVLAGTGTFGSTYPTSGLAPGLFDGTNLVRPRGDETLGAWVNVKASVSQAVTNAGTFAVQNTNAAETTKVLGTIRNVGNVGGVFDAVSGATYPANLIATGVKVGANIQPPIGDPCETNAATWAPISVTTATTTRIIAPSASNRTYVCYMFLTSAAADNVGIVEGTGGTCGTGTAGVVGGTTAANGPNFSANGGAAFGNGRSAVLATAGTNVDFCLITSAATPLAGSVKYVQAP